MKENCWEKLSETEEKRELSYHEVGCEWYFFIFDKRAGRLRVDISQADLGETLINYTPEIPLGLLLWLINGDKKIGGEKTK